MHEAVSASIFALYIEKFIQRIAFLAFQWDCSFRIDTRAFV
jgi:hypothetical protein